MSHYPPHVYIIPEDRADEQLANGFVNHDQVDARRIDVERVAGGWREVLKTFEIEYVKLLRANQQDHVVLLVDFDGHHDERQAMFEQSIPDDLKQRVFVIGPKHTPETLKQQLGKTYEQIGMSLANDCHDNTEIVWSHDQLKCNDADRHRMIQIIRPFLFP